MAFINLVLLFAAGILLNMALLHFFSFVETRHHPVIARSSMPHLASALWATLQLALAIGILLATQYRFQANLDTLAVFLGFAGWGILLGLLYDRKRRQQEAEAAPEQRESPHRRAPTTASRGRDKLGR